MKENCGDLKKLEELGKNKTRPFTTEQLLDENFKNVDGESRVEVACRMEKSFERIIMENKGKSIAIVSHGAAIKFLLIKWCKLNQYAQLEYNDKIIKVNSPGVIKLIFEEEKLKELIQIV